MKYSKQNAMHQIMIKNFLLHVIMKNVEGNKIMKGDKIL